MDEKELTAGVALLAEEADPAPIDVDAVIAAAKARSRHRKTNVAAAFATVAVIGGLAVTLSGGDRASPSDDHGQSTQTVPSLVFVQNWRSAELTDQLAAAWPSIKPPGVAAERSLWQPGQEPLVFLGQQYGSAEPDEMGYVASTSLVDAKGRSQLSITIPAPDDPTSSMFTPCSPLPGAPTTSCPTGLR